MRKFGMTLDEYDVMLDAQNGGCAICTRAPEETSLHVDHDHSTGRIRALLCFQCNNALADFREDPDLLRNAVTYLITHTPGVGEEIELARRRALSLRTG